MCWTTKTIENTVPITADEDIKVIKFLGIMPNSSILMSPFNLCRYKPNMLMPSVALIPEIDEHGSTYISKGYHSYDYPEKIVYGMTNSDITKAYYGLIFESFHLLVELPKYPFTQLSYSPYECVIPKGTKYYINEDFEIVSETITVKNSIESVTLWI